MASIALIGPGAIGGTVAAALAEAARHDLILCAHQKSDTLSIIRADNQQRRFFPVTVITREQDARSVNWVLVAVKSYQTPSIAPWLKATVGQRTRIAILQNGVEHRARIAPFLQSDNPIVPVIVMLPAERTGPGQIVMYGRSFLTVADDAAGREFVDLFTGTFVHAQVDADFRTREWEKLCMNAASGALSVLTCRTDAISSVPGMVDLAARLVSECMAVGQAEGARFAAGFAEELVKTLSQPDPRGNSMFYDRRDGKPLEWDARNGVIVRLGRKHGIPTPISDTLVPLLRALDLP